MGNFSGWENYKEEPVKKDGAKERIQALGRLPVGVMNKTEAAYDKHLKALLGAGHISWYSFEPINIRLASKCYYRVDFLIMFPNGVIEAHEVKGFWQDDALVKFKVAAALLPFKFKAIRMNKALFETILEI